MSRNPIEEARTLLKVASQDLEVLRVIQDQAGIDAAVACFHAQQCVEKGLKAVLAARGVEYPFTHSIQALLGKLEEQDFTVPFDTDLLELLNPCAVRYRYGDEELPVLSKSESFALADSVWAWANQEVDARLAH